MFLGVLCPSKSSQAPTEYLRIGSKHMISMSTNDVPRRCEPCLQTKAMWYIKSRDRGSAAARTLKVWALRSLKRWMYG